MSNHTYRPDIDGLRAIAVLAVVLFHAGVPFLGGGFVGVDVFFVISGYLITSLILADMDRGSFTLSGFWERRIRRILPALFVVVMSTLTAGWFLLLPDDFASLGKEAKSQAIFSSNFLFYKDAGYFDVSSHLKPLLHTWSLAVEEQFYIFFPLAALFIGKRSSRIFLYAVIGATIVSLGLGVGGTYIKPDAAFYLLPFRAWELFAGSLLAFYARRSGAPSEKVAQCAGAAGLIAIFAAIFLYTKETIFPGYAALLPVAGAVAVIWSGLQRQTWVGRGLSLRPVVFIGLISYSWYLWHWPVLVFARYVPSEFTPLIATACVAGSFLLAVLSWKFIEQPFRHKRVLAERVSLFKAAAFLMVLMLTVSIVIRHEDGFPARMDAQVLQYAGGAKDTNPRREECEKKSTEYIREHGLCRMIEDDGKKPAYIVWGDSYADAMIPLFTELSKKYGINGYMAMHHGCPPVLDHVQKGRPPSFKCTEFNTDVFNFIKREKIKNVFLIASWSSFLKDDLMTFENASWKAKYKDRFPDMARAGLMRTIDLLQEEGVRVFMMGDIPVAGFDPSRILALEKLYGVTDSQFAIDTVAYNNTRNTYSLSFIEHAKDSDLVFLDPGPVLCGGNVCKFEDDGYSLYFNATHLSAHGAVFLAPLFEPYFKSGFSKP